MKPLIDILQLATSFLVCAALIAFTLLCIIVIAYVLIEIFIDEGAK